MIIDIEMVKTHAHGMGQLEADPFAILHEKNEKSQLLLPGRPTFKKQANSPGLVGLLPVIVTQLSIRIWPQSGARS